MEKNNKNLNVPNLRFPEFSGEWEKALLNHYLEENKERNKKGVFTKNDVLSVSGDYGVVNQIELLGRSFAGKSVLDYHVVRHGNIVYTKSPLKEYPYGIVKVNDGVDGIVSTLYAVYMTKENVDGKFIENYFGLPSRTNRYFKPIVRIGAKHDMKIGNEEVLANYVIFPQLDEQKRISEFISLLDQRIETQKKIIEDLKKLKDAICNLNLTSGSVLKLGNAGKFVRGLTYSASDVIDYTIGTAVMRSNNISNGDPVNFEELVWVNKTPNHEQILRSGDIVICMANGSSPLVGKASYYVDCGIESATVGAFCGIYRSDNPLTKWLFQSKHYKKHIQRCIQGGNGAIANIYPEDILAISFNIPCGYERVLNILNSLEEKYLLEQKLLSRYLGVKSYLLSRLFI